MVFFLGFLGLCGYLGPGRLNFLVLTQNDPRIVQNAIQRSHLLMREIGLHRGMIHLVGQVLLEKNHLTNVLDKYVINFADTLYIKS